MTKILKTFFMEGMLIFMKIIATRENLQYGINTVQKAVSIKNTIPVLSGIRLKTEGNKLYMAATDLEIGIECFITVQVLEEGEIVLPARQFSELVRRLPDTKIAINYLESIVGVEIKYNDAEVNIKGWPGDEFPVIPELGEGDYHFEINPNLFKNMVKQTIFATSNDDSRPIFTGALLETEENDFKLITTDSHRLALRIGKGNIIKENNNNLIIPAKALGEFSRIIKDDDESIQITGNNNQICFKNNDTLLISRLIDGRFPDYRQVIPDNFTTLLKIKTKDLQETVERANLFSGEKDGTSVIKLKIDDGYLNISSKSDLGKVDENIPIFLEGESLEISFNARYILDVLKVLESEDLTFSLTGPLSPGIIKSGNHDNYTYLILPLRN